MAATDVGTQPGAVITLDVDEYDGRLAALALLAATILCLRRFSIRWKVTEFKPSGS